MTYSVKVTSQGQITIPSKVRKQFSLDGKSITMLIKDEQLILKPAKTLIDLGGTYKDRAIKGKTIDEVIKLEKEAYISGVIEKH